MQFWFGVESVWCVKQVELLFRMVTWSYLVISFVEMLI